MKRRADVWRGASLSIRQRNGLGFDRTGRSITRWTKYFGYDEKAEVSLNSILGYMPTIPDWGYNGNARRYWDFYYGAAPGGELERQIHHYGSGINAIPVLGELPDRARVIIYLLRVGYAGTMAPLSNIDPDGFRGGGIPFLAVRCCAGTRTAAITGRTFSGTRSTRRHTSSTIRNLAGRRLGGT